MQGLLSQADALSASGQDTGHGTASADHAPAAIALIRQDRSILGVEKEGRERQQVILSDNQDKDLFVDSVILPNNRSARDHSSFVDEALLELLTVADPDLELSGGGGGGAVLIYLPWWPFSFQSFLLFLPKIRGDRTPRAPPLDQPLA